MSVHVFNNLNYWNYGCEIVLKWEYNIKYYKFTAYLKNFEIKTKHSGASKIGFLEWKARSAKVQRAKEDAGDSKWVVTF